MWKWTRKVGHFSSRKVGKFWSTFSGAYFFRNGGKLCPEMMCYIPYIGGTFKVPSKVLRGTPKPWEQIPPKLEAPMGKSPSLAKPFGGPLGKYPRNPLRTPSELGKCQNSPFRMKSCLIFSNFPNRKKKSVFFKKNVFFFRGPKKWLWPWNYIAGFSLMKRAPKRVFRVFRETRFSCFLRLRKRRKVWRLLEVWGGKFEAVFFCGTTFSKVGSK